MWQNWNLVIKPNPDTFKNITNSITSNHQSTPIYELVYGTTLDSFKNINYDKCSAVNWNVKKLVSGQLRTPSKISPIQWQYSAVNWNVTKVGSGQLTPSKISSIQWQVGEITGQLRTVKNITNSMTSIQQSTEMWQICELVIGPTPDTFKNITNSITSNHQSTSIWQFMKRHNSGAVNWNVTNLWVGNRANSGHRQKYHQFNDKYSAVNWNVINLWVGNRANSGHLQKYHQFNDKYSAVNWNVTNLWVGNRANSGLLQKYHHFNDKYSAVNWNVTNLWVGNRTNSRHLQIRCEKIENW